MKIKISRTGLVWWLFSGGPLGQLFWLLQIVFTFLGAGGIISGDVWWGIAMILLLPATLIVSVPLWLLWVRIVKPAAIAVAGTFFELKD